MAEVVIASAIISALVVGIIFFFVISLASLAECSFKDIITGRFITGWWRDFKTMFNVKEYLVAAFLLFFVFFFPVLDAYNKLELQKQGKCTCSCEACKENSRKMEAVIKYLGFDEEDIKDILEEDEDDK